MIPVSLAALLPYRYDAYDRMESGLFAADSAVETTVCILRMIDVRLNGI
ncbi:hypothetical protein MH117_09750 [Paenibacillus sp. ACRRX]|nr:hypothetical protein [Paenibacillus sp. ACRRX]MCG7407707.1 hypothetical protein [Paenibacillus sp. ACRRX]